MYQGKNRGFPTIYCLNLELFHSEMYRDLSRERFSGANLEFAQFALSIVNYISDSYTDCEVLTPPTDW